MSTDVSENVLLRRASVCGDKGERIFPSEFSSLLNINRRVHKTDGNKKSALIFNSNSKHVSEYSQKRRSLKRRSNKKQSQNASVDTFVFRDNNSIKMQIKETVSKESGGGENKNENLMTKARRQILKKWMAEKLRQQSENICTIHEEIYEDEGIKY